MADYRAAILQVAQSFGISVLDECTTAVLMSSPRSTVPAGSWMPAVGC